MPRTYRFVVGTTEAGLRLDHYLRRHLPLEISRSRVQRAIRGGTVTVEGAPAKVNHRLHVGDTIQAQFHELSSPSAGALQVPQEMALSIVYEDEALLVVDKPAGLVTHPAPGHWTGTLVNALVWHLQQAHGSRLKAEGKGLEPRAVRPEQGLPRAGIVHRLDKDTSGLLMVAKTASAHEALAKQLSARRLSRTYLALVEGHMPVDQGTIEAAIGRHHVHRKVMTVRHVGGRSAVSHYRVLGRFNRELRYTLLEVSLETGRTHQIRVHLSHLGHPVLGDVTYGRRGAQFWESLGITRQLLHARAIRFRHPVTRADISLRARLPDDFKPWVSAEMVEGAAQRTMEQGRAA